MGKYLMALDAGTGSVRAVLFDLEGNQLVYPSRNGNTEKIPVFPAP